MFPFDVKPKPLPEEDRLARANTSLCRFGKKGWRQFFDVAAAPKTGWLFNTCPKGVCIGAGGRRGKAWGARADVKRLRGGYKPAQSELVRRNLISRALIRLSSYLVCSTSERVDPGGFGRTYSPQSAIFVEF